MSLLHFSVSSGVCMVYAGGSTSRTYITKSVLTNIEEPCSLQ